MLVDLYVLGADVDAPAVRHGFARVDDQRVDDLFDLADIDFRLAEVILDLDRGAQIRAMEREFRRVLQEVRETEATFFKGAPPLEKVSN